MRHLQVNALETYICIFVVKVTCFKFVCIYVKYMYNMSKELKYLSINLSRRWNTFCFSLQLVSFKSFKAVCLSNRPLMLFGWCLQGISFFSLYGKIKKTTRSQTGIDEEKKENRRHQR